MSRILRTGSVLLATLFSITEKVNATVAVDLRFSDGTKSKVAAAGTYEIDVWAQMSGINGVADERLLYLMGSIQSIQRAGGAIGAGSSGITGNSAAPAFTLVDPYGQAGIPQNATNDGVIDWGTNRTSSTTTIKYNSGTFIDFVAVDSADVITNLITSGVEFKLGSLEVTLIGSDVLSGTPGGITEFSWMKPTGSIPVPFIGRFDGASSNASSTAYVASGVDNSVQFITNLPPGGESVPEPASTLLFGIGVLCLGARRRQP